MGIKSPISYGDYYWNASVEAAAIFDEQTEQALAPFFAGVLAGIPEIDELPMGVRSFLGALAEPPSAGLGGFAGMAAGEFASETIRDLIKPGMTAAQRFLNKKSRETWLTSRQANVLFQRKKITEELWTSVFASEGYEDVLGKYQYDAMRPFPAIPDLLLWARYHGDPENVWGTLEEVYDFDPVDFDKWDWLGLQRLSTGVLTKLKRRELIDPEEYTRLMKQVGWRDPDIDHTLEDSWLLPNAMLLVQGGLFDGLREEEILKDISRADIHPDYAKKYLDAVLTKPSSQDIIAYELRKDPGLSELDQKLERIGVHPAYTDVYRTLAYQIPPIGDIITMAVREAFTPSIAARFGQYEDYPDELTEWGQKKGLSEEWTKRYWAAHWSLPSPQQGFEMLHRGIIDKSELDMLLRALDVMPFWRSRLTDMAFRPLTRIDVRRMFKEGILDEAGVYKAYLDNGYAPDNAERMTKFTVKFVLSQQSKFTTTDIIAAFSKRMISSGEAYSLLSDLGIRSENISYIISTAEYKREWAFTESRITGIRNMYKRSVFDENKTRDELSRLNLPGEQVNVLMEQWWFEDKTIPTNNWTKGETLRFIKAGYITIGRGSQELRELGYDDEHIAVYLRSIE